jgi:hypothetical protein
MTEPHALSTTLGIFYLLFYEFLNLEMIQLFIHHSSFISSSISMRSYKLMVSIFWDVKLQVFAPTSLGFRKLYAETRSGSKT